MSGLNITNLNKCFSTFCNLDQHKAELWPPGGTLQQALGRLLVEMQENPISKFKLGVYFLSEIRFKLAHKAWCPQ